MGLFEKVPHNDEKLMHSGAFYLILVLMSFIYYPLTLIANYQNYQRLATIIFVSVVAALIMVICISIYGMTLGDWVNDPGFVKGE